MIDPYKQIAALGQMYQGNPYNAYQGLMANLTYSLGTTTTNVIAHPVPEPMKPRKNNSLAWLDRRVDEVRVKL